LARVYAIMPARQNLLTCLGILLLSRCSLKIIVPVLKICGSSFSGHIELNIDTGLTILYDAAIFGVTVYHTWTLIQLRRSLPGMTGGTSLASLILKQGILRFLIICVWSLQIIITDNLVRPSIKGLTTAIGRPVSLILILRFFLDLREWNAHQCGTSQTRDLAPCSSFMAAARKLSNSIIEDLGDPEDEALFTSHATSGIASRQVVRPTAFPWPPGRSDAAEAMTVNNAV